MAKTGRKLVDVEPEFFRFTEEQRVIAGIYVSKEEFTYRNGDNGVRYILCDENDKLKHYTINGNATLNRQMDRILPGTYVEIEWTDTYSTNHGNDGKIMRVKAESVMPMPEAAQE